MLKYLLGLILFSISSIGTMFILLLPEIHLPVMLDLEAKLNFFEGSRWYGSPRYPTLKGIPRFPAQLTIVKVCSMCKNPYWMAFPSNLTMQSYYFAGENGITMETKTGVWDIAETRVANAVLSFGCRMNRQSALMVDIGTNIGYFTGMALAAGCRVVAFEPTAYHHPYVLMTSILSGHQDRLMLYKLAASNKTGDKIPYNDWSIPETVKQTHMSDSMSYVYTTRVDDIIHEDILFLKIDVEGHESQVIQGLKSLLKSKKIWVILWENALDSNPESIEHPVNYLKKFGYLVSDLHHGGTGNYIALHPQIDSTLRETIMSMKEMNIKNAGKHEQTDW